MGEAGGGPKEEDVTQIWTWWTRHTGVTNRYPVSNRDGSKGKTNHAAK